MHCIQRNKMYRKIEWNKTIDHQSKPPQVLLEWDPSSSICLNINFDSKKHVIMYGPSWNNAFWSIQMEAIYGAFAIHFDMMRFQKNYGGLQ